MGLTDPYCPCPLYITPLQISVSKKVLTSYMQGWATVCPSYGSPILVAMALIPLKNVEKSWPVNLLLAPLVFYLTANLCVNMLYVHMTCQNSSSSRLVQVSSVDCSPSSSLRAVSSGTDRTIKVWDLNKGYCLRTIMCHSSCNSVRCTRDEHLICSGHFDGTLRFWDIRTGKMANEVTGLHTQQICSVQIGTRDGNNSLCMHVCQTIQVCFAVLLMLSLL